MTASDSTGRTAKRAKRPASGRRGSCRTVKAGRTRSFSQTKDKGVDLKLSKFIVTDQGFYKKAILLIIPVVLQSVISQGVNMMDTIMAGRSGGVHILGDDRKAFRAPQVHRRRLTI